MRNPTTINFFFACKLVLIKQTFLLRQTPEEDPKNMHVLAENKQKKMKIRCGSLVVTLAPPTRPLPFLYNIL